MRINGEYQGIDEEESMQVISTNNRDMAGLIERLDEYIYEVLKSGASNVSDANEHDHRRLTQNLGEVRSFATWVVGQPIVDQPKISPRIIRCPLISTLSADQGMLKAAPNRIENKQMQSIAGMLHDCMLQVWMSDSSRIPNNFHGGLKGRDIVNLNEALKKIEQFIADHVKQVLPMDLPESNPNLGHSGAGSISNGLGS